MYIYTDKEVWNRTQHPPQTKIKDGWKSEYGAGCSSSSISAS